MVAKLKRAIVITNTTYAVVCLPPRHVHSGRTLGQLLLWSRPDR